MYCISNNIRDNKHYVNFIVLIQLELEKIFFCQGVPGAPRRGGKTLIFFIIRDTTIKQRSSKPSKPRLYRFKTLYIIREIYV